MNQNEEVTLVAQRCQHGVWHSHNALVLPDGSTVDDPEGPCPGGTVRVGERTVHISHALAGFLRRIEGEA